MTAVSARGRGLALSMVVLAVLCVASIAIGSRELTVATAWNALVAFDGSVDHIAVRELRVPRTAIGVLVGAGLGVSGAVMQGITRNPLAGPGILGVNGGAALAVVIGIAVFGSTSTSDHVWFAVVGATLAGIVVYLIGAAGPGGASPVTLALAGAATSALLASLTTTILLLDAASFDQYRFWVVGSLANRGGAVAWQVAPLLLVGLVLGLATSRALNNFSLGDQVARAVGTRLGLARGVAAVAVVATCAAAVAAAGPIAFVGLTVPHVARRITGPDYRWVTPYSAVLAAVLILASDLIGRTVARPGELQVGIVTALLGAPFFVVLIRRRRLAGL